MAPPRKTIGQAYGLSLASEYLAYLVRDDYLPEQVAQLYIELSRINQREIHYFLAEALVEYCLYLSQEEDTDTDMGTDSGEETIH